MTRTPRGNPDSFPRQLVRRARQFRKEPTPAEAMLWDRLRDRQLAGLQFRRQQVLERFIADFLCAEAKLVVELDGPIHKDRADVDQIRDEVLSRGGLAVLRIKNEEVISDCESVLARISAAAQERLTKSGST